MRNIKLVIEYDGTNYYGSQRQKNHNTIQAEVEKALSQIFKKKIKIILAGRTDSGVHAKGQVANFFTDSKISLANIKNALNGILPRDIAVSSVSSVSPDFHARYSAKGKVYQYTVLNSKVKSPLRRLYAYQYSFPFDISLVRKGINILEGKHDFSAFEAKKRAEKSSVRDLRRITLRKKGSLITFTFEGNGFLYNMVRNIVGTLLLLGRGKITLKELASILKSRRRQNAGPTAPANGLVLVKVIY